MGVWFSVKARSARFFQFWKDLACAVFDVWFEREECAEYDGEDCGIPGELVERITLLAEHGYCNKAEAKFMVKHGISDRNAFCLGCFDVFDGKNISIRPDYWSCICEGPSARRWLKENGLPVPKPRGWMPEETHKQDAAKHTNKKQDNA